MTLALFICIDVVIYLGGVVAGMELIKVRITRHASRLYAEAFEMQLKAPPDWESQMLAYTIADHITDQADEIMKSIDRKAER